MHKSNKNHDFDSLNQWATWQDSEIKRVVSADSIALMQRVVFLLADEKVQGELVVDGENFVELVKEMAQLYRAGSRMLGDAILQASDFLDRDDLDKAKDVYQSFLSSCPSRFYRNIAKNQLDALRK